MQVSEDFIQYLWQFGWIHAQNNQTEEGQVLTILSPGILNTHAGPDFELAHIQIDGTDWYGHVEIHTQSVDWYRHNHQHDPNYNNVILHVIWDQYQPVYREDGTQIPTLKIYPHIPIEVLYSYQKIQLSTKTIPCHSLMPRIHVFQYETLLRWYAFERLEKKRIKFQKILSDTQGDWEEAAYRLFCTNFGIKANEDFFYQLSIHLPSMLIKRNRYSFAKVEALWKGVANVLPPEELLEYMALQSKYNLPEGEFLPKSRSGKFRPHRNLQKRLDELIAMCSQISSFFSIWFEYDTVHEIRSRLIQWSTHPSTHQKMHNETANNLIINTAIPLLYSYGVLRNDPISTNKAIKWLQELPSEKNKIINYWPDSAPKLKTALHSQSFIHLYAEYCSKKRCLECRIGHALLRESSVEGKEFSQNEKSINLNPLLKF